MKKSVAAHKPTPVVSDTKHTDSDTVDTLPTAAQPEAEEESTQKSRSVQSCS